jgi:diguanylate cyclase (GGDEF)-like protein
MIVSQHTEVRPAASAAEPRGEAAAAIVRREQISSILRLGSSMLAVNACNATVLVAGLWATPQRSEVLYWALGVFSLLGFMAARQYRHRGRLTVESCRQSTINKAIFYAFALGLCWAPPPLLFFHDASPGSQLLIACLCAGMLGGGALALSSIPLAAVAFTTPILLGSALGLLRSGADYFLIVAVLGVYAFALLFSVFAHASQIKSRALRQLEAEERARTDNLTGLPNRLAFNETLEKTFERRRRSGECFALLHIDLVDFKLVNDRFGRLAGDELLQAVAKRLRESLKPSEIVARLDNDEFAVLAVLAEDATREEEAIVVAHRVTGCFEEPFEIEAGEVYCGACVGVAVAPRDGIDSRALARSSDIALYRAKQNGGLFCIFEPGHDAVARAESALVRDLRRALHLNQFRLVFQPIVNIASGEIVAAEALLRWTHPDRGPVSPAVFIPIAERTGFIHDLGLWVIDAACRTAAKLPRAIRIAVNVSAVQLRDPRFAERALQLIADAGLAPDQFEIEITETALLSDDRTTHASIRRLAAAGVGVSLDDFGAGYSSLNHLLRLPLDRVKIDRCFVTDVLHRRDCAAIVRGLIGMVADLGLKTVGEGVEDAAHLDWLRRNGCTEAQGFYLGAGMPETELAELLSGERTRLPGVTQIAATSQK